MRFICTHSHTPWLMVERQARVCGDSLGLCLPFRRALAGHAWGRDGRAPKQAGRRRGRACVCVVQGGGVLSCLPLARASSVRTDVRRIKSGEASQ